MPCRHRKTPPAGAPASLRQRFPSLLFIWWALGLALTAGFGYGLALFLVLALGLPIGLWRSAMVQAHGHVQLFGWAGLFALGVGLYFLPRLRGCPPPDARAVRAAAWLLGVGLALRGATQPLAAALEPGPVQTLASAGLAVSGPLELAGAIVAVAALARAASEGPPLANRAALLAVLPFAAAFFVALLLGLAANAVLLPVAVAQGNPLLPAAADWNLVHLGLSGMLLPISAAISARTFPLYLRLRIPPAGELYAVFGLLLAGFLLRSSYQLERPDALIHLPTTGTLLEGIAMLALVVVLDVPLRRTRRVPPGRAELPLPEYRAAEWLILPAFAWVAFSGVVLVFEALAAWGLAPRPPVDAERHALGAGVVTLLILGMGVRLLPGFAGRKLHSARLVWATVWLANAAALLRVGPLFLPGSTASLGLLSLSGLLALAALGVFAWNLWRTLGGDGGTAGRRDGGTAGWRDGGMAGERDGGTGRRRESGNRRLRLRLARERQLLDAVIEAVRDVEIALPIQGYADGRLEPARSGPARAPLGQGLTGRRELLDAVVAGIRHIQVALPVQGHAVR